MVTADHWHRPARLHRRLDELETPPLIPGPADLAALPPPQDGHLRRHRPGPAAVLYAFGGALFFSEADANYTDTSARAAGALRAHPFGTDTIGRDILARTIYGGQISLLIGLTAMLVEMLIGVLIGAAGRLLRRLARQRPDALHRSDAEHPADLPAAGDGQISSAGKIPNIDLLGTHLQRQRDRDHC